MFTEVTKETLTADIVKATTEGQLLKSSADFLLNKLDKLNDSDNQLTENEIKIIEKQLEYHIEMANLKGDFDLKKVLMRKTLKKEIKNMLDNMNSTSISDTELLDLECKLEQGLFNDSKNIIDDKLNNTDFSFEGIADGFLNYEFIGSFEQTNNFLNYFTLELLDANILVDESRNKQDDQLIYSDLSIDDINLHIINTVKYLIENELSFPGKIELKHGGKFISINLLEIKANIDLEIEKARKEAEVIKLQEEREKNKEYLVGLLGNLLSGSIDSQGLEVLERKFEYKGNIDDGENEGYISLLNKFVNEGYISKQYILDLYDSGGVSKIILLNYLEQDKNFNYLAFIENYGLTKRVQKQGLDYARNILKLPKELTAEEKISNPKKKVYPDELILKNLQIFISIFLNIESKGKNVKNQQGSSAKGYFQFLTLDGKYQKKKIEKRGIEIGDLKGGSFQTGLNRTRWVLSKDEFTSRFGLQNSEKERDQNPMDLSAENQTILFFANITGKDLYITNKGIDLNDDGAISDKEAVINVGVDKNNDGIISGKEIKFKGIDVYGKNNSEPDGNIEYSERLQYVYNSKDIDGNGKIDKSEVRISKRWVDINKDGEMQSSEVVKNDARKVSRFMDGVLKENHEWSLGKIYKALHHRQPTKATLRVFRETINEYYYGDKKYIAKNHY